MNRGGHKARQNIRATKQSGPLRRWGICQSCLRQTVWYVHFSNELHGPLPAPPAPPSKKETCIDDSFLLVPPKSVVHHLAILSVLYMDMSVSSKVRNPRINAAKPDSGAIPFRDLLYTEAGALWGENPEVVGGRQRWPYTPPVNQRICQHGYIEIK